MTFAALLDTCVLYPMYLGDSLLRFAGWLVSGRTVSRVARQPMV